VKTAGRTSRDRAIGLPITYDDAGYALQTETFALNAGTGLTVRVSAPVTAPLPGGGPGAFFDVWDSRGAVDDPNVKVTVLDTEGRDWGMGVAHSTGGHYGIGWVSLLPGTHRIEFSLTASGVTYFKDALKPVSWKVGPPVLPVLKPADLKGIPSVTLLDITLHPIEWVQGAKLVMWSKIAEEAASLPKDRLIAVYNSYDGIPRDTAVQLKKLGFNVAAIDGGLQAFKDAGWVAEKEADEEPLPKAGTAATP
jgi:rhodanese-related sulfurtransferase